MEDEDEVMTILKLLIIGESGVGKSSLMMRFTSGTFSNDTASTIGVDFKTSVVDASGGSKVKLAIWDTAGSERFRAITPSFYRGAHGVILVYDVMRPDSLEKLSTWMQEIEVYSTRPNLIKMLIGNKIDQVDDQHPSAVSKATGLRWAQKNQALFIEASAKTDEGVSTAFRELVDKIIETPGLWEPMGSHADRNIDLGRDPGEPTLMGNCWNSVSGLFGF